MENFFGPAILGFSSGKFFKFFICHFLIDLTHVDLGPPAIEFSELLMCYYNGILQFSELLMGHYNGVLQFRELCACFCVFACNFVFLHVFLQIYMCISIISIGNTRVFEQKNFQVLFIQFNLLFSNSIYFISSLLLRF